MQRLLAFNLLIAIPLTSLLFITPASGQNVELDATAGFGSAGAEDLSNRTFANFGAGLCALCNGRFYIRPQFRAFILRGYHSPPEAEPASAASSDPPLQGPLTNRPGPFHILARKFPCRSHEFLDKNSTRPYYLICIDKSSLDAGPLKTRPYPWH